LCPGVPGGGNPAENSSAPDASLQAGMIKRIHLWLWSRIFILDFVYIWTLSIFGESLLVTPGFFPCFDPIIYMVLLFRGLLPSIFPPSP